MNGRHPMEISEKISQVSLVKSPFSLVKSCYMPYFPQWNAMKCPCSLAIFSHSHGTMTLSPCFTNRRGRCFVPWCRSFCRPTTPAASWATARQIPVMSRTSSCPVEKSALDPISDWLEVWCIVTVRRFLFCLWCVDGMWKRCYNGVMVKIYLSLKDFSEVWLVKWGEPWRRI